jgi:hypothetical protein
MGLGNNELIRNIDNLNSTYMQIESSASKKENFMNKEARLIALRSEGENLENEREEL